MKWEFFCDESYYSYWAVRPIDEGGWGKCFHLVSKEEAISLVELLTRLNAPNPFTDKNIL